MLKSIGFTVLVLTMFFSCAEEDCPTCPVSETTGDTANDTTISDAPTKYEFVDANTIKIG